MKWLILLLLPLLSIQFSCTYQLCSEQFPEMPGDEVSCIQVDSELIGNETCDIDPNVTFTVVDSQAGTVSVEFKLASSSCRYHEYQLALYIEESLKSEIPCMGLSYVQDLHSERVLKIVREPDENEKIKLSFCKNTEKIVFHHVYTGCYILKIEADRGDTFNCTSPVFIETNYTKSSIVDKTPKISHQYLPTEKELDVNIEFDSFRDLQLCLYISDDVNVNSEDPCYKTGLMHTACKHTSGGNFMCKAKNRKTIDSSTRCSFDKDGDIMSCSIKNVTSGVYCVMMQIYDDRCKQDTVWYNGSDWRCLFNTNPINVTAEYSLPSTTAKQTPSAPVFDIVISVVAVLCLISIGTLLFLWLRGKPKPQLAFQPQKQALSQQKPSIVLLYALDCKPFMTLMSLFRDILKEITKCEVYDCFDPERAEEIALNKTDWLRRHMGYSKIVLVENKCAVLHQKALLEQFKLRYKETVSMFVDDLFMYGLKMVTDDCFGKNMYERVLVVRIDGFTETKDVLSYVAPLIRYAIPQNMEQLLTSLYQSQSEYEMDSRMLKFVECLKNLENYKAEKPDYLNEMFIKESEPSVIV